jgi:hypothetical protein
MDASCAIANYPKLCFAKQGGIYFSLATPPRRYKKSAFDVTFTTWLIQRKDIDLGWVISRTSKYALFPTYSCN